MAFDGLSSRLQMALRRVTGRGSLTEKDIDEIITTTLEYFNR